MNTLHHAITGGLAIATDVQDPYHHIIKRFVVSQFPEITTKTTGETLELVTQAILATGQVRYGPVPPVETQVEIRKVISHWIQGGQPIPFVVPFGSEKPDGSSIDFAELAAVKVMHCLNERIRKAYNPGAVFSIRIEDASAPHLFADSPQTARDNAARYTGDFVRLLNVLNFPFITPRPESLAISDEDFAAEADKYVPALHHALTTTDQSRLGDIGWRGIIAAETIDYYLRQYDKLYPGSSVEQKTLILARYFAAALTRGKLGIRGDLPEWQHKFIDLSFTAPAPGTEGYFNRRVVYRTLPGCYTSNHIPPWRAKGYLQMSGDNSVVPKLASFNERKEYNANTVTLSRGGIAVDVRADYVVSE